MVVLMVVVVAAAAAAAAVVMVVALALTSHDERASVIYSKDRVGCQRRLDGAVKPPGLARAPIFISTWPVRHKCECYSVQIPSSDNNTASSIISNPDLDLKPAEPQRCRQCSGSHGALAVTEGLMAGSWDTASHPLQIIQM